MRTTKQITTKQITRLSEYASFTVEVSDSENQRRVTYYYQDPDKKLDHLMAVSFPLGASPIPPVERAMVYVETEKCWSVEVERPIGAREHFILIPNVFPESALSDKEQAVPVAQGYLSFKNGVQQPVNRLVGVPTGTMQELLYTEACEFKDPVSPSELEDGDRLISIYFPPGYDAKRDQPYNVQIVLDGKQYLDAMQMNAILDNLIFTGQIEPVVSVFVSPYTGAPNVLKPGLLPVTPAGYSISQRFKEYSCNPVFADRLASIPDALRKRINITTEPNHTTIWGMSMSALQSAYTALLHPEVFGNVVSQSMMSWNIPTHRGLDWRDGITEDWTTSTALLPYVEQHNEHITQMVRTGFDSVSARAITPSTLNFYFDAGNHEDQYDPGSGFANLVKGTALFISELESKKHTVLGFDVVAGGHDAMTWMGDIPTAATRMHSPLCKESAVEIMVFKPDSAISPDQRGVHENLWIKQRVKQYVSIGVYLDDSSLKYYFFENCDNTPKIYSSLIEVKQDLPSGLENIFEKTPKLYLMGHARGDSYGLGNYPVEICGADFDKIITDFEEALPEQHDEIVVTLEACNTDNCEQAARGNQEKTFLARLSETHQNMTFCGTGPWDPKDPQTGYRASGGFPTLNVPITSMGGSIWKNGNSVIFYHETYQAVVRKSMFSSTATAKQLKINTMQYARKILEEASLDDEAKEVLIKRISGDRGVLKIEDLKSVPGFPKGQFESQETLALMVMQAQILEKEKNNYIRRVQKILARTESGGKFTERDVLIIALGLKNVSVFKGHEDLCDEISANKNLLSLIMVTCGKVLIAGPSNDSIIDFLLERGIDINSVDEKGMTALHYAVQNFYNYREEPLNLIKKLLNSGANIEAKDKQGRTPLMIVKERSEDRRVSAREEVQKLLEQRRAAAVPANAHTMKALLSTNLGFFRKLEDEYLTEHRHDDPRLQHEYDKRFGLVLKH